MQKRDKITIHLSGEHVDNQAVNKLDYDAMENEEGLEKEMCLGRHIFVKRLLWHFLFATGTAVLLGGILGLTLLKIIETNTVFHQNQPGTQVDMLQYPNAVQKVSLEKRDMLFVQLGVYQSQDSVERLKANLPVDMQGLFAHKKDGKYYVLHSAYDVSGWTKEMVKQRYQAFDKPVYVYQASLSKKNVVGNLKQLNAQREGLFLIMNRVQKGETLMAEEMARLSDVFSTSAGVDHVGYGLFLQEMRKLVREGTAESITDQMIRGAFFLYYQWNEDLQAVT